MTANMTSPFLEKLPLEIRLEIYRYLVGRHTRLDHDMNSKAYDQDRSVNFGPDHSQQFHDAILRVNRQTRTEALDILQSETVLISLRLPKFGGLFDKDMAHEIKNCGVAIMNREDLDCPNPPFAMSIEMIDRSGPDDERMDFIFTAEDLPAACVYLQRNIQVFNDFARDAYICVETCPSIIEEVCLLQDNASPRRETILSKCLEPLRHIRGAGQVHIYGPTSHYTTGLIATMTERRRSAKETMDLVAAHFDQGDKYLLHGAFRRAITEYKAACHVIESGIFGIGIEEELVGGRFHGLVVGWARDNAKVQLHAKIASTYLQLGQPRMARIYVAKICVPLAVPDGKGWLLKFILDLPYDENTVAYAELLFVAAQISIATGNECHAEGELEEAHRRDPERKDISMLWEQCLDREEDRRKCREKRRQKTQGEQQRSYDRKCEVDVQGASNRIAKADELFRVGDLVEAREWYKAAYQKISQECYTYSYEERIKTLRVDSLTQLTRVSMELQDDDAVRHWVDTIHALHHSHTDYWFYNFRYESNHANEAFYTAYYSKAVMLQRQGKITAAIRNFEAARIFDRSCQATYYQLENLKRQETDEDIQRHEDACLPEWEKMELWYCATWLD